jgi:hypothetical protein
MKNLYIDVDELYPFFSLKTADRFENEKIQLSNDDYLDYLRVMDEFHIWQNKILEMKEKK